MDYFELAFTCYFLFGVAIATRIMYIAVKIKKSDLSIPWHSIVIWVFIVVSYIVVYMFLFSNLAIYLQAIPFLSLGLVLALHQKKNKKSDER